MSLLHFQVFLCGLVLSSLQSIVLGFVFNLCAVCVQSVFNQCGFDRRTGALFLSLPLKLQTVKTLFLGSALLLFLALVCLSLRLVLAESRSCNWCQVEVTPTQTATAQTIPWQ